MGTHFAHVGILNGDYSAPLGLLQTKQNKQGVSGSFHLLHCFNVELANIPKLEERRVTSFATDRVVNHDIYLGTEARSFMFEEHLSKPKCRGQDMMSVFYTISPFGGKLESSSYGALKDHFVAVFNFLLFT